MTIRCSSARGAMGTITRRISVTRTSVDIRNVDVAPVGDQVKIEVTLTQPVVPTVIVATNPDRLVLELPNTSSSAKQQRAVVNQGGVKMVRIGLNSANPPVTRVVLDL